MLFEVEYHEAVVAQTEFDGPADDVRPRNPEVVEGLGIRVIKYTIMAFQKPAYVSSAPRWEASGPEPKLPPSIDTQIGQVEDPSDEVFRQPHELIDELYFMSNHEMIANFGRPEMVRGAHEGQLVRLPPHVEHVQVRTPESRKFKIFSF